MPYIVPNRRGNFNGGARGFTAYDNAGNFWGYFPTGRIPQCNPTDFKKDPNCPKGALKPAYGFVPQCSGGCGSKGCYPQTIPTCPAGYDCVSKVYAPWGSCNIKKGILF